tara:strand:- start:97 stop:342 length:246 start_codon:yes stop_codon:yes gene_type:complete
MDKTKITPQTYIDMNEEFERNGDRVRIEVPTQEAIDKWQNWKDPDMHERCGKTTDMVAELWAELGVYTIEEREQYRKENDK